MQVVVPVYRESGSQSVSTTLKTTRNIIGYYTVPMDDNTNTVIFVDNSIPKKDRVPRNNGEGKDTIKP